MKIQGKISVLVIALSISCSALAWKIGDTFKGMNANVTKPGTYQSQAGGMYSGGGFSLRNTGGSFRPCSITPPSFEAGCNGIDAIWGGFSLMSGAELVNATKTIAKQAATYAFQLGIKTYAPQIETLLSELRDKAMEISQFAIEDCQLVQSMFAAALPSNSPLEIQACQQLENSGGRSYFSARDKCKNSREARGKVQNKYENALIDNFNLFVVAAKKASIGNDLIETLMSFAGTLIVKDGRRSFFDSLVFDETSYRAHLKGGTGSQYVCNERSKCLDLSINQSFAIAESDSYQGKASKRLNELFNKMISNTELSNEDIGFIDSVGESFPIYNYLSIEAVTGTNFVDRSSDLLANLMLQGQLSKIVHDIKVTVLAAQSAQLEDTHFREYLGRLDRVQNLVLKKSAGLPALIKNLDERAASIERLTLAKIR